MLIFLFWCLFYICLNVLNFSAFWVFFKILWGENISFTFVSLYPCMVLFYNLHADFLNHYYALTICWCIWPKLLYILNIFIICFMPFLFVWESHLLLLNRLCFHINIILYMVTCYLVICMISRCGYSNHWLVIYLVKFFFPILSTISFCFLSFSKIF